MVKLQLRLDDIETAVICNALAFYADDQVRLDEVPMALELESWLRWRALRLWGEGHPLDREALGAKLAEVGGSSDELAARRAAARRRV